MIEIHFFGGLRRLRDHEYAVQQGESERNDQRGTGQIGPEDVSYLVERNRSIDQSRQWPVRLLAIAALPVLLVLAGCGGGVSGNSSNTFSVSPNTAAIDTNCTGCNATNTSGVAVEQFMATLSAGGAASVNWSVSGGDTNTGAGAITTSGQYTPPVYLTTDSVKVTVTATLTSSPFTQQSATVTVTPGFLQPLTPENVALGTNGAVTITGYIAEARRQHRNQLRGLQHSHRVQAAGKDR